MNQNNQTPKKKIRMIDVNEEIPKKETNPSPIVVEKDGNYLTIQDLPSKFLFYPEESKISIRPMNVSEVKLLASMDENNYESVINDVVKRTVKGINYEDITRGDKYYVIFWLRANTYKQSGYEMDFDCRNPSCKKKSKYNFTVEVFDVLYAKDNSTDFESLELPVSKDSLVVKYIRIKDENRIRDFLKILGNAAINYDSEFLELAASIESINDSKKTMREKYEYVEKMSPIDFSKLVSFIDSRTFGIKQSINAKCSFCGEETPVEVFFRKEFFLPKFEF